jgi:hypothetical protein
MGLFHSPKIITDSLVLGFDVENIKCYPGSGTTISNLSKLDVSDTISGFSVVQDSDGVGSVLDLRDGPNDEFDFNDLHLTSHQINKFNWTMQCWIRRREIPASNYRSIWTTYTTDDTSNAFYFKLDTRTTTDNYLLAYTRNDNLGSYPTLTILNSSDFANNEWNNVAVVMEAESSWKAYLNGKIVGTYTSSDLDERGELIKRVQIGNGHGCNTNNFLFYEKALSASEVLQNFEAQRSRYGI